MFFIKVTDMYAGDRSLATWDVPSDRIWSLREEDMTTLLFAKKKIKKKKTQLRKMSEERRDAASRHAEKNT